MHDGNVSAFEAKVTVTVEPAERVDEVAITLEGNTGYADLVVGIGDPMTGITEVKIKGKKETPNPSLLKLKAELDTVTEESEVRVVVPKKNEIVLGAPFVENFATSPGDVITFQGITAQINSKTLATGVGGNVKWTIIDQYEDSLDSIYDGNQVVEEDLKTIGGNMTLSNKGPIKRPTGDLSAGVIDDSHSIVPIQIFAGPNWTSTQQSLFRSFTGFDFPVGNVIYDGNSVGDMMNKTFFIDRTQTIEVHGHPVPPMREFHMEIPDHALIPANLPADVFKVTP